MNSLVRNIKRASAYNNLDSIRKKLISIDTDFLRNYDSEFKSMPLLNHSYKKLPLYQGEKFDLYYIQWDPLSNSGVHGHPNKNCFFKTTNGCLSERFYPAFVHNLNLYQTRIYNNGSVGYIDDTKGFHNIYNPCEEASYSLNLYIQRS